jgi:hypothetical protein
MGSAYQRAMKDASPQPHEQLRARELENIGHQ